jgi:FtsP/CotA-like multicopper oxidase with cupredoxin domain
MARQVYNGLAGMWLVEDEISKISRSLITMAWMTSR